MDIFVFVLLTALEVVVSAGILFFKGGPGIVGVCGAVIPLLCGVPLALFIFMHPAFKQKFQGMRRAILPALIPVVLASIWFGILMHDQDPKVTFKRLLSDPIPAGISNIRAYDDSGGFDVEYGLAFDATPEAIDRLLRENNFTENNENSVYQMTEAPFEYFPDVKQDQEWLYYSKVDKEQESIWFLWVNADKNVGILQFIGY